MDFNLGKNVNSNWKTNEILKKTNMKIKMEKEHQNDNGEDLFDIGESRGL